MSISFLMLMGRKVGDKYIWLTMLFATMYTVPLWTSIYIGDEELIGVVTTASYTYFVVMVVLMGSYIIYRYNGALRSQEELYAEDIMICVRWMGKSLLLLVGLAVACIMAPLYFTYPYWLRLLFMVYGVLCYLHIYYGYRRIMISLSLYQLKQKYDSSNVAQVGGVAGERLTIGSDVRQSIAVNMEQWIESRGYCERSINIVDVAKRVGTNRTYLSKFINSEYNCSFRSWVTQLRLAEAKMLLSTRADLTIAEIAQMVGSASVESFTHIFTRKVGVAPASWRDSRICNTQS